MQRNSRATWVPCTANSLNLVGQNAAECRMSAVKFSDFLEKVSLWKGELRKHLNIATSKSKNDWNKMCIEIEENAQVRCEA